MKKSFLKNFLFVILAVITGGGIAIYRISDFGSQEATVVNGVWKADKKMDIGNDKLLTARVARAVLFALKNSEVIYMMADKDNEGEPLSSESDYIISGIPINSRYWSITLYGTDYFLVPNEPNRFSFNMANVGYESDSSFNIYISAKPKEKNWLPSGNKGNFYLTLRMYHPEPEVYENLETVKLPDIKKVKQP